MRVGEIVGETVRWGSAVTTLEVLGAGRSRIKAAGALERYLYTALQCFILHLYLDQEDFAFSIKLKFLMSTNSTYVLDF